jgi:tetratricopeptide (TPR) repeat protein
LNSDEKTSLPKASKNLSLAHLYALLYLYTANAQIKILQTEYANKNLNSAVEIYEDTLRVNRFNTDAEKADVYNNIGFSIFLKEERSKSLEFYSKAIELNPDLIVAYFNRAASYRLQGNYKEAFSDVNKILEIDKNNVQAYLARAQLYQENATKYNSRFVSRAIEDYSKALDLQPDNSYALYKRSQHFLDRALETGSWDDVDLAVSDVTRAIEIDRGNPDYYFLRGRIYMEISNSHKRAGNLDVYLEYKALSIDDLEIALEKARSDVQKNQIQDLIDAT